MPAATALGQTNTINGRAMVSALISGTTYGWVPSGTPGSFAPAAGWANPVDATVDRNLDVGTLQDTVRVLGTLIRDLRTVGVLAN